MPYHNKQKAQDQDRDRKFQPEEQFVPDQPSYGMPNSLMRDVAMTPPPGTPNSVMREMDPEDSGVLFRSRGFSPSGNPHELSHIVMRESVPSPVTRSVPSGTIQRDPDKPGSHDGEGAAAAADEELDEGESLESQLEGTLKGARSLRLFYAGGEHMMHWRARQLRAEADKEDASDPDTANEIRALAKRLDTGLNILDDIIEHLTDARARLAGNPGEADLESIRRLVIYETRRHRELVSDYWDYEHFDAEPNVAPLLRERKELERERKEYEREINEEAGSFVEVEDDLNEKNPDYGFTKMGAPARGHNVAPAAAAAAAGMTMGGHDVPPAEAVAVTPGSYDETATAAAAVTPGDYDEPPAGFTFAEQETDEGTPPGYEEIDRKAKEKAEKEEKKRKKKEEKERKKKEEEEKKKKKKEEKPEKKGGGFLGFFHGS